MSTGHGFAALSRRELLLVLQERCRELGVELHFEREVASDEIDDIVGDADLVLGADGVNSAVRGHYADHFRPRIDLRKCRFAWFGTDLPMEAFTFLFEETPHGLFQVHAYPFDETLGTFIVECREEVWERAGLAELDEVASAAFCHEIFAEHLGSYRLLTNRSIWRRFPTVRCGTWVHADGERNVLLMGDSAHTAHFSIGSGTKLAMEDAIVLMEAFEAARPQSRADVPAVLRAYEDARWVDVLKLQKAAQTSLEWFEESARWMEQPAVQFTFNLMTRSKRITYDELRQRDPKLVGRSDELFRRRSGAPLDASGRAPVPIFTPYRLGELELANRIVVSPMCQYSAEDGVPNDWHLVHLGNRALGGAGLVLTEMTDVSPDGRITAGCTGLWNDEQMAAWRRIIEFGRRHAPATRWGVQLAHAGRKGSAFHPWEGPDRPLGEDEGGWETIAPSALVFDAGWPLPREMTRADMDRVRDDFVAAVRRAEEAGFDLVELHMAHGYLLSSFLSSLTNRRGDEYGGSLENRLRFPLEVLRAAREAWPSARPLAVRITAHDWMPDGSGMTPAEAVEVARALHENGCDLVDVSSGGNVPDSEPVYGRMYQTPFADRVRHEVGVSVMAVGAILGADHANTVLAAGRTDLVAMARPHLRDPFLTLHAAQHYERWEQAWPLPYLPAAPRPPE